MYKQCVFSIPVVRNAIVVSLDTLISLFSLRRDVIQIEGQTWVWFVRWITLRLNTKHPYDNVHLFRAFSSSMC